MRGKTARQASMRSPAASVAGAAKGSPEIVQTATPAPVESNAWVGHTLDTSVFRLLRRRTRLFESDDIHVIRMPRGRLKRLRSDLIRRACGEM